MKIKPGDISTAGAAADQVIGYDGTKAVWMDQSGGGGGGGGPPDWSTTATGTGSSQNITLPSYVYNAFEILVFVNGLKAVASSYTVAATALTITAASGAAIEIVGWNQDGPPLVASTRWRFYNSANNGGVLTGFGDIYLYDGATNLNPSATATSESAYAGTYTAANGKDGIPTTWCLSNFTNAGYWFQWDFVSAVLPTEMRINRGTVDTAGYLPRDFRLQYWDGASWIDAGIWFGQTAWGVNETRIFSL